MSLYGYRADITANFIKEWGKHVHENVGYWRTSPAMVIASVTRSFDAYHRACNDLRGELGVAKKTFSDSTWKGFVNVPLSAEQKEAYGAWDVQDADVWDGLASYGEKGYKFSLTYNNNNSSWIATYTGQEGSGKNEGYAVNAFAGDPYNAARVLLFKVSNVLPDVWKDFKPQAADSIG